MKCAAVLAKRWQSDAHGSLDGVARRMGSGRQASLLLNHHSKGPPWPRPYRPPIPVSGRHRPCPYGNLPQQVTTGDPCDRSLLYGFEAGECECEPRLVVAGDPCDRSLLLEFEAGGHPEGFLTIVLCSCAFVRAPRKPNLRPQRTKRTPKHYPGPKRNPKKNPRRLNKADKESKDREKRSEIRHI